mmetsp:Transcript_23036/g.33716  ORF Transcript_23036/g.33716 Transcript_23036/m.33716 type:complete len:146 (+) Transcript_23036:47-484(+)
MSLLRHVRLRVPAGAAKPGPAIGQALGPLGLNMSEFCKQFNDRTKNFTKDVPMPVVLSAYDNRSFTFVVKSPPTSWFLKRCAGIDKGANRPGHETVGKVHTKQIYEIAKIKQQDEAMKNMELEHICRCIVGSCLSMGLKVVHDEE